MLGARLTSTGGLVRWCQRKSGRSSGVEHNLAKVGVEGSNPFARSSIRSVGTNRGYTAAVSARIEAFKCFR
jgi:hypothetical protein